MKKNVIFTALITFLLLLFASFVRVSTFVLPHDNGDQVFYLGLAMKLDKFGFSGYTMRGINVLGNESIIALIPTEEEKGSLLKGLARSGVTYYDEPLFHRPYGFAYALMLSHRLFAGHLPYVALNTSGRDNSGRVHTKNLRTY